MFNSRKASQLTVILNILSGTFHNPPQKLAVAACTAHTLFTDEIYWDFRGTEVTKQKKGEAFVVIKPVQTKEARTTESTCKC